MRLLVRRVLTKNPIRLQFDSYRTPITIPSSLRQLCCEEFAVTCLPFSPCILAFSLTSTLF
jgi:hypothetical protein